MNSIETTGMQTQQMIENFNSSNSKEEMTNQSRCKNPEATGESEEALRTKSDMTDNKQIRSKN